MFSFYHFERRHIVNILRPEAQVRAYFVKYLFSLYTDTLSH